MEQLSLKPLILALGLTVVTYEVGLRVPALAKLAPKPKPFYDAGVSDRLSKLESVVKSGGPVDVLAVGSSVVRTNILPKTMMQVWSGQGTNSSVFNAGLSALQPDEVVFMTEKLLLTSANPKVVVQFVRGEEAVSEVTAEKSSTLSKGRIERSWQAGQELGDNVWKLTHSSKMAEYYGAMSNALAVPLKPLNGLTFPTDAEGFGPTRVLLSETRKIAPSLLEQPECNTRERMSGAFPTLEIALSKAKALATKRGVRWVIVPMPEHPSKWKDPEAFADFVGRLEALAKDKGLEFANPFGTDLYAFDKEEWWSDYHHMSPAGAEELSRRFASAWSSKY